MNRPFFALLILFLVVTLAVIGLKRDHESVPPRSPEAADARTNDQLETLRLEVPEPASEAQTPPEPTTLKPESAQQAVQDSLKITRPSPEIPDETGLTETIGMDPRRGSRVESPPTLQIPSSPASETRPSRPKIETTPGTIQDSEQ